MKEILVHVPSVGVINELHALSSCGVTVAGTEREREKNKGWMSGAKLCSHDSVLLGNGSANAHLESNC